MREAVAELGGDPAKINPLAPAELVIDHSVIADVFGTPGRLRAQRRDRVRPQPRALPVPALGADRLRRVQGGAARHRHRAPGEHRAPGPRGLRPHANGGRRPTPTRCVGTDSHTTMVNGLGVLGWGVGGIEAEAAMLGQPVSMLIPRVVGFKLHGELPAGATATDLVLTITEMLRKHGVVGKFVEFYGAGVAAVPLANRATIGNMSPEFGSTCAIFPIDDETISYLRSPAARPSSSRWSRPTPRSRACGTTRTASRPTPSTWSWTWRPWCPRSPARSARRTAWCWPRPRTSSPRSCRPTPRRAPSRPRSRMDDGTQFDIDHGAVVIASITSCTNTSNPSGDARRGAAGQEGGGEGPARQAVGQDHPGARLEGRHRLLRARRA